MRKEPKQERSRETVDAILEATARILARRGWAGLNTNEVAEVAGVSVGSLYQYFPNKLSLIEAVRNRHFQDVLNALDAANDIEQLVQAMIDLHNRHPAIHNVLLEETPRSRDARVAHDAFEAEYLRRYEALIPRGNIAAQVASAAIAGVIHDSARRGTLALPGLKKELVRLISAYLR
jgi:AcrR family transcriptional regulator